MYYGLLGVAFFYHIYFFVIMSYVVSARIARVACPQNSPQGKASRQPFGSQPVAAITMAAFLSPYQCWWKVIRIPIPYLYGIYGPQFHKKLVNSMTGLLQQKGHIRPTHSMHSVYLVRNV